MLTKLRCVGPHIYIASGPGRRRAVVRIALATLAPALIMGAIACRRRTEEGSVADVVAVVEGHDITRAQWTQQVEHSLSHYTSRGRQLPPGIVTRIEESVMRRMVDDAVVEHRAHALDVAVTSAELDAKLTEHKGRFRTEEAFADYLQRAHTTEAALREDLRKSLLRDRVVDKLGGEVTISEADVASFYAQNTNHFVEPEQMRARRILVAVPLQSDDGVWRAAHQEAQHVAALANKPRADFLALARKYGKGPEASRDGDLSILVPGRMPELDQAVANGLRPQHISGPIKSAQGWALFRLDEHRSARQRPLDEVHDGIRTSLLLRERNERRQEVLRQLKSDAKVDVRLTFAPPPAPIKPTPEAAKPVAPTSDLPP